MWLHACYRCVCGYTGPQLYVQRADEDVEFSITLYLIPLRQGFLLTLQLAGGWAIASGWVPSIPFLFEC